ncbi:hypothetical protein [Aquipseudomonas campi]
MEQKHSGLGIASFIISIVTGILIFLLFIVAGVIESSTPGGINEESTEAIVLGLFIILMLFINLVAIGLGIGGLCQSERKKIFAILGTIFSSLTTLLAILLIIVGNSM